jgi:NAD(P)-dependent dehydrogenase (short-subunit alcohol dehydrogenase family)
MTAWLMGRRVLAVGAGPALDAVALTFESLGATVVRTRPLTGAQEIATSFADAEIALGGAVDVLLHAGWALPETAPETLTLADWRDSFSADIDGRFLHAAEFARRAMASEVRGAILFLMPARDASAGRSLAATADGALDNLVKSLAVEWGRDGLRINAIASRTVERFLDAPANEQASLGALAAYLVSDYAAYVTGTVAGIDETAH